MKSLQIAQRYLLLAAWVLLSKFLYANDGYITVGDGLSNRHVTCILQDKYGLIWVGTSNGLNVYDGYTFKSYYTHSSDLTLSNSRINCIAEDDEGNLWIGTERGLNKINTKRSTNTVIPELQNQGIISILRFDKTHFMIGTKQGSIILIDNTLKPKTLTSFNRDLIVTQLDIDRNKNVWVYSKENKTVFKLKSDYTIDDHFSVHDNAITNFVIVDTLIIFGCGKQGYSVFDNRNGKPIKSHLIDSLNAASPEPLFVWKDKLNAIWLSYRNGTLLRVDLSHNHIDDYSLHFLRAYFGSNILCITEDENQLLWIGTDGGLVKIASPPFAFRNYLRNNALRKPENIISIRGMLETPDSTVYIGSYRGLFSLNKSEDQLKHYVFPDVDHNIVLPFQMIWDNEKILMTTVLNGLLYFDIDKKKFAQVTNPVERLDKELFALFKDSKGTIWVGTQRGLRIFDAKNKILTEPEIQTQSEELRTSTVWKIIEYPAHVLWACTSKGLFQIHTDSKKLKSYNLHTAPFLSNDEILCITPEGESLWIGSRGGGMMKLDINKQRITYFNTNEGLNSDIIYSIIRDGKYLWLSTENGICRFDPSTGQVKGYYEKDGISNNEFNNAAYLKTSDGRIIFGGIDGITVFNPHKLFEKKFKGRLILTSLRRGDEELLKEVSLTDKYEITLPYDNRNLSLQFTLTDYFRPEANHFYYQIEGLDNNWVNLASQNFLRISQPPAGEYTIQLKSKNINDLSSLNQIAIRLHVEQIFYKRAWFISIVCLVLISVIYLLFKFRERQLLRVQTLRTKIASDLHDDVGSMLTRISILTEVLKFKNQEQDEVTQIAQASRQATSTMSDVLWSVDARNDKIENLVDRMREHANALLLPHQFALHFDTHLNDQHALGMQTRQNILLIFKEAVHNIVKHAHATEVFILLNLENKVLTLSIRDNGNINGLLPGNVTGQGLRNMQMRAKEIRAVLTIEQKNGYHINLVKHL